MPCTLGLSGSTSVEKMHGPAARLEKLDAGLNAADDTSPLDPRRPNAAEVAMYSDEQLNLFLNDCVEGVATVVDVEDPENLPESFVRRLRERAKPLQPKPINLEEVSARLAHAAATLNPSSEAPSAGAVTPSTDDEAFNPEEEYEEKLKYERECYDKLIKCGVPPWFPITRLHQVSKNPEKYYKLLQFWCPIKGDWEVFPRQHFRWTNFCKYQENIRSSEVDFAKYAEGVRARAADLGVEALENIHLEHTAERQERLSTWVEYLEYEHRWYRKHSRMAQKKQEACETAWHELVASGVLLEHETKDYIATSKFAHQFDKDRKTAELVMRAAQREVESLLQTCQQSPAEPQLRLARAEARLAAEEEALKPITARYVGFMKFRSAPLYYDGTKRDAQRCLDLVRWVLAQVPAMQHGAKLSPGVSCKRKFSADATKEEAKRPRIGDRPLRRSARLTKRLGGVFQG